MVVGDPAGMRALANRLAKDADQLRGVGKAVKGAWSKADAAGEWADACTVVVGADAGVFTAVAGRLDNLAATLRRSASDVAEQVALEERQRHAALTEQARQAAAAELARHAAAARATAASRS